jgi:dipeptidyl aminopeptidase/acylaminoacyl peptidase
MNSKFAAPVLTGLLLFLSTGARAAEALAVPDSIVAKNVPVIPRAQLEDLQPYENLRTAGFEDWHPTERRILITTRFAETDQLHEVAMPGGDRRQVTFQDQLVNGGLYRPNDPHQLVFSVNEDGAENFQFFLLDRKNGRPRRFTDGKSRYTSAVWSDDGRLLAYTSNARNGRDSDLYVADPATPNSERRLAEVQGSWAPLDWSADGKRLALVEYISANESHLYWLDVASGKIQAVTPPKNPNSPKKGEPTVAYQGGIFSRDANAVYTVSDRGSEFARLVRIDLAGGRETVLSGDIPWDVEGFDLSDDGKVLAYFINEDGISKLHFLDTATGRPLQGPELPALPPGVANGPTFRPNSHEVAFTLSWARSPTDVYSYDADSGRLERWTTSEVGGLDPEGFAIPELIRYPSFDQRTIPAFVYRPPADRFPGKRPVYINIHGGPEGQSRPGFLQSTNYLLNELGVALIYPNVRGSSGYGKTYLKLDNAERREDSVKDIGALLDWIAAQPDLDASRVMVAGGSYGGYMVLAALTFYSDRLCCAYDSVGISNFVTFLENTQEYRRDLRRAEYGDERDPKMRQILEQISPANRVDRITKPLLVAQGANDPRVPLSESDQIVAAVEKKGVPVWYVVGKDEGHGFRKKSNVDYMRAVMVEFVRRNLLK